MIRATWAALVYFCTTLRMLVARECPYCGGESRRGDTACDWCWKHGVSRSYGIEE